MQKVKFLLIILMSTIVLSEIESQDSLKMRMMARVDGMPGNEYNDIWGYIDDEGKEYAIIGSSEAINIYDVTDCSNPVLIQEEVDGNNTIWRDFKTYDHYVYGVCDQGAEGLEIINMEDESFVQYTGDFVRAHNIFIDEPNDRLYVVGSNTVYEGMIIYDLAADPWNPTLLKKVRMDTLIGMSSLNLYIHDVYVKDNIAYASHGYSGYYIWDVSDVENITLLGDDDSIPGYNHSSWLDDTEEYSYMAREVPKGMAMVVYELNGNTNPVVIHEFKDPLESPTSDNNRPHNPFVLEDKLFISYYEDGTVVYDIKDPENPSLYAYYDTYSDNNGSGYGSNSSYNGQWGVYPYLPSGCIIASDISYGLYTMNIELGEVKQTSGDLLLLDGKLVQKDLLGNTFAIGVDINEEVEVTPYVSSTVETKLIKSDFHLETSNSGIYFKAESGNTVKLTVNTDGTINISQATPPLSTFAEVQQGDLIIENVGKGVILTDSNGDCWKLRVEDNSLVSYKAPCW